MNLGAPSAFTTELATPAPLSSYVGVQLQSATEARGRASRLSIIMDCRGRMTTARGVAFSTAFLFALISCWHGSTVSGMRVPALIAFGDSIVDTGNNDKLATVVRCDFPPYGRDFADQRATGRFSNGLVPADMIASALGIKSLLPPYLNTTDMDELLTGVSFASGGSGYDPLTAQTLGLLSMDQQLNLFQQYKAKITSFAGPEGANWIISDALYVITGGNNDIINTFYTIGLRKPQYTIFEYTDFLVTSASKFVQSLYKLGARRMGVLSLPPLGCLPFTRSMGGGSARGCVEEYNRAALLFNGKMQKELLRLNGTLDGTEISFIDTYDTMLDLVQNPGNYGFDEATKGCCGSGQYEMAILCNNLTSNTCPDDTKYVFWDSFHPTERAYEIMLAKVGQKYLPLFM